MNPKTLRTVVRKMMGFQGHFSRTYFSSYGSQGWGKKSGIEARTQCSLSSGNIVQCDGQSNAPQMVIPLQAIPSMQDVIVAKSISDPATPLHQVRAQSFCTMPQQPSLSDVPEPSGQNEFSGAHTDPSEDTPNTRSGETSCSTRRQGHENGICKAPALLFHVKKLSDRAVLPSRASLHSAGYDLSSSAKTKVPARGKAMIPTDLSIAVPEGTYARIAPRSGLAWKHSIDVGAGVIDADCRGPVEVILFNHSNVDFKVKAGDRIAQLILEKIVTPEVEEVDDLDATERGSGGFGSTGI